MDLSAMLPLLLKNNKNPQTEAMMAALGGDRSKIFESLLGKDGNNKEMLAMLNMMQQQQQQNTKPRSAQGLNAIYNFAPTDILGIMLKHYSKPAKK